MKLLICVPAYGSTVRVETMNSIAVGMIHLQQQMPHVEIRLFSVDMAEIARVRNLFASLAMKDDFDALLMVDSDMGIPPETFARLLASGHEVCGLTYPKRQIDLQKFHALAASGVDFEKAKVQALTFIAAGGFVHDNGQIQVTEGFLEMRELPGGCLLIRTSALHRMWREIPKIRQTAHISDLEQQMGVEKLIRCFDNVNLDHTKLSEDLSFCHRWRSINGRIFGLVDVPVTHCGNMNYEGRYIDLLMATAKS
ncbi:MAG: hypothetical protein J0I52_03655 [Bordetella sp.]|nr:hypothetical protein [Bordetella sp.]